MQVQVENGTGEDSGKEKRAEEAAGRAAEAVRTEIPLESDVQASLAQRPRGLCGSGRSLASSSLTTSRMAVMKKDNNKC